MATVSPKGLVDCIKANVKGNSCVIKYQVPDLRFD